MPPATHQHLARSLAVSSSKNSIPRDAHLPSISGPYESLLPRIPSPSLYLEDLLEAWPSNPKETPPLVHEKVSRNRNWLRSVTDSGSTTALDDFSDLISAYTWEQPPSLLSPAPRLFRGGDFQQDPTAVECRLPPTTLTFANQGPIEPTADTWYASKRNPAVLELHQHLRPSLRKSSMETDRPSTPVPSLTHSRNTASSSSVEYSPAPVTRSRGGTKVLSEQCRDMNVQDGFEVKMPIVRFERLPKAPRSGDNCPRLSGSSGYDNDAFPRALSIPHEAKLTRGTVLDRNTDKTSHMPPLHETQSEVSYIDWDDDEKCGPSKPSALVRLKRGLTELRTAERFISDAQMRTRLSAPEDLCSIRQFNAPSASAEKVFNTVIAARPPEGIQRPSGSQRTRLVSASPTVRRKQRPLQMTNPEKLRRDLSNRPVHTDYEHAQTSQIPSSHGRHQRHETRSDMGSPFPQIPRHADNERGTTTLAYADVPIMYMPEGQKERYNVTTPRAIRDDEKTARLGSVGKWFKRGLTRED
ncbi:hypothetical protein A1O1_00086 [Capronia coronata CBS 617.96]|uniref:Uncharacterized protein n=1 Tax=Capronia coronata CBS 617.96 TaxID=1182541 RepID=W9YR06_9EURO|nr:uncharacterized protein A1O1_00086 [Capronia coronata CBS 617.96]EXJ94968.1 hypothetical protein A1O1_00086 [Capronia coronata CBS 617.96]